MRIVHNGEFQDWLHHARKEYVSFLWEIYYALHLQGDQTLFDILEYRLEQNEDFMKKYAHLYENHPEGSKYAHG